MQRVPVRDAYYKKHIFLFGKKEKPKYFALKINTLKKSCYYGTFGFTKADVAKLLDRISVHKF